MRTLRLHTNKNKPAFRDIHNNIIVHKCVSEKLSEKLCNEFVFVFARFMNGGNVKHL